MGDWLLGEEIHLATMEVNTDVGLLGLACLVMHKVLAPLQLDWCGWVELELGRHLLGVKMVACCMSNQRTTSPSRQACMYCVGSVLANTV